jgi:hypothetical protein
MPAFPDSSPSSWAKEKPKSDLPSQYPRYSLPLRLLSHHGCCFLNVAAASRSRPWHWRPADAPVFSSTRSAVTQSPPALPKTQRFIFLSKIPKDSSSRSKAWPRLSRCWADRREIPQRGYSPCEGLAAPPYVQGGRLPHSPTGIQPTAKGWLRLPMCRAEGCLIPQRGYSPQRRVDRAAGYPGKNPPTKNPRTPTRVPARLKAITFKPPPA